MLLNYFLFYLSKISDWKNCGDYERYKKYRPSIIIKALKENYRFVTDSRSQIYKIMSEYAVHPTHSGFKLIRQNEIINIGPFFDTKYLDVILGELIKHTILATLIYLNHFKNIPNSIEKTNAEFLIKIKTWARNNHNIDLCFIDINSLKNYL